MKVRQQQQIAATAGLAVHAPNDLREKLSVKIRKHHADGVRPGKAEAARARMRHVTKLTDRVGDPRLDCVADIFGAVQRAGNRCDGDLRALGDISDRRVGHDHGYRLQFLRLSPLG